MRIDLRPLSLGQILDRSVILYRSYFPQFAGITVFPVAAYYFLFFVVTVSSRGLIKNWGHNVPSISVRLALYALTYLIYPMLMSVSIAATFRAIFDLYLENQIGIARSYRQVKSHALRYASLRLVAVLYTWTPALVLYAAFFGLTGVIPPAFGGIGSSGGLASIGWIVVGFAVGVALWMTVRYSLCVPASTAEDLKVHAALKRSAVLTRKGRGRIFAAYLIFMGIPQAFRYVIGVLLAHQPSNRSRGIASLFSPYILVGWLGGFIIAVVMYPLLQILLTNFYLDERIRKEGFDIEFMMARANLTAVNHESDVILMSPRDATGTVLG